MASRALSRKVRKQDQWALMEAVNLRTEQTGDPHLAIAEIEQALAEDKLASARLNLATGESEQLTGSALWRAAIIVVTQDGWRGARSIVVRRRPEGERPWFVLNEVDDHVYFVSRSDFDRLWPAPEAVDDVETPPRGKPGRKVDRPWKPYAAKVVIRLLEENRPVTAKAVLDELSDIGVTLNESYVRRFIRDLLTLLRQ